MTKFPLTERDTKAEKPKADKAKAEKVTATKKAEDEDESEEKPKYESKPGDKADVNTYKNSKINRGFIMIFLTIFNYRA